MRADARKNRDHLLAGAGAAIAEQGVDASMRDIARRADVGLATLLRHFPTREALLEGLLHTSFDELTARAGELETSNSPEYALVSWLRDCVAWTTEYRGVTVLMAAAIEDTDSALSERQRRRLRSATSWAARRRGRFRNAPDSPVVRPIPSTVARSIVAA